MNRKNADAEAAPAELDLGYLGFFLGLRINELVARRLAAAGFEAVKQSHGYVIQHLVERGRTITELARRMEVTQQAASKTVAEMVRLGILETTTGEDRRAKEIWLSERARQAVREARKIRWRIDTRLMAKAGADYAVAKKVLLDCIRQLGGMRNIASRRIREPR